eukprot:COSAG01_NODE_32859_length_574_cov_0.755789_1_plen_87_part_10
MRDAAAHEQRREELLNTQREIDRANLFDDKSKVDLTTESPSQRMDAGLQLRNLFQLESLVAKRWRLPQQYVDAINAQLNARVDSQGI